MSDVTVPAAAQINGVSARSARAPRLTYVAKTAIVTFVTLIALWWLAAYLEVVPAMFLPSPHAVARKAVTVWTEGFEGAMTGSIGSSTVSGSQARLRGPVWRVAYSMSLLTLCAPLMRWHLISPARQAHRHTTAPPTRLGLKDRAD